MHKHQQRQTENLPAHNPDGFTARNSDKAPDRNSDQRTNRSATMIFEIRITVVVKPHIGVIS
jgi:hypothetical protein